MKRRIEIRNIDDVRCVCIPVMIKKESKWLCIGHLGVHVAIEIVDVLEES